MRIIFGWHGFSQLCDSETSQVSEVVLGEPDPQKAFFGSSKRAFCMVEGCWIKIVGQKRARSKALDFEVDGHPRLLRAKKYHSTIQFLVGN